MGMVSSSLSYNIVTWLMKIGSIPWVQVSLYVMYRWLDSGSGISALQRYLWMPIDQYAYRSITTAAYNHVMSLSHDFHTNKKTGDLYSSVNQGRSVNGFIESVLFSVLPMLADLCVAFVYFYIAFNSYMALIVAVVSMVYLWVTARLGARKNQMRRDFNAVGVLSTYYQPTTKYSLGVKKGGKYNVGNYVQLDNSKCKLGPVFPFKIYFGWKPNEVLVLQSRPLRAGPILGGNSKLPACRTKVGYWFACFKCCTEPYLYHWPPSCQFPCHLYGNHGTKASRKFCHSVVLLGSALKPPSILCQFLP